METVGNWYWIVSEIEQAGMVSKLVHALRAKMMLATVNKTDRLDARGMNRLQRSGTLPTVWIPSAELRDQRELFRTRMVFTQQRTRLKNRVHATLAKYALRIEESSDAFSKKGRQELRVLLAKLPPHARYATERVLEQLDSVMSQVAALHPGSRYLQRSRRYSTLHISLAFCFLCGNRTPCSCEWGEGSSWATAF